MNIIHNSHNLNFYRSLSFEFSKFHTWTGKKISYYFAWTDKKSGVHGNKITEEKVVVLKTIFEMVVVSKLFVSVHSFLFKI